MELQRLTAAAARCSRICRICFLALISLLPSTAATAEFQRTRIAVLGFTQTGDAFTAERPGPLAAKRFTTGLVESGRFEVVERQPPRAVDEGSLAALGRDLGVKAVVSGSVKKDGRAVEVEARVIGVDRGEIIAAETFRGASEQDLSGLVDQLTTSIIRNLPLTGYVVKKSGTAVVIDLGLDSGLAPGTEFIVYREGQVTRDPQTGEILDIEQVHTGRLRITTTSKNVAKGRILKEKNGGIAAGQLVKSMGQEGKFQPKTGDRP